MQKKRVDKERKKKRLFKFYRDDFGALPIKVLHMDLNFDIYDTKTTVLSHFKAQSLNTPLKELKMNAKNLELLSVDCDKSEVTYDYKTKESILLIRFKKSIPPNTAFTITTKSITRPTKNILEGLYYDETPKDCPPTQITQCQQWGFQRLVPCIDEMNAKCTYTTTIAADERYTNIITNGDIAEPRTPPGNGRVKIRYDNTITPMAPYLFFLGVGTYATFTKEFEYPDGKKFMLELLVPPKSDRKIAQKALQILHDAIMWIHLFTGPKKYENVQKSREILALIKLREQMKQAGKDPKEIRNKLKGIIAKMTLGYKYTGTVYREIGMQNSDFGGMENVGNTTITTNRIMPFPDMTDGAFEYLVRVKAHEFYHNLNGSEVTGQSPFEIWLNEAVTVHVEKEYHSFIFGEAYSRLQEVQELLSPDRGTFLQDEGAMSMPIEPDGFNDPNELITSITYVKAPEFVRMIETLLGKEQFVKGLDVYHRTYKHGNATRAQWIECMEKVSGLKLLRMAQIWLKTKGFPHVGVKTTYDNKKKRYAMTLRQANTAQKQSREFPFVAALVDAQGNDIAATRVHVTKTQQDIVFRGVLEPAFISLNREYSFYGKVEYKARREQLLQQVLLDKDIINRFMAWYYLTDEEKMKLLQQPKQNVDRTIIDLYYNLLSDAKLMKEAGAQFVALFESVENQAYAHRYQALFDVKKKVLKAIATAHKAGLVQLYNTYNQESSHGTYMEQQAINIKNRQVKNVCLSVLALLDTPNVHAMILHQFKTAGSATDKVLAFRLYLNSSAADKLQVLSSYMEIAGRNLVSWETFLAIVGGNDSDDALDIIKKVERSPAFRIEQTNDQRALYGVFASNKKKSLQTEEGRQFLKERLIKLAAINEYTTVRIVSVFATIEKMETKYHAPLIRILADIKESLDAEKTPSIYNTIKRMLANMPKAVKEYNRLSKNHLRLKLKPKD